MYTKEHTRELKRENFSYMISNQPMYIITPMSSVYRITCPAHESLVLLWSRLRSLSHFSPVQPAVSCFFTTVSGKGEI